MKTQIILIGLVLGIAIAGCKNKEENKSVRITIVNSSGLGNDTSIVLTDQKDKEDIERIIYKLTQKKVNLNSEDPHNVYVFQFTDRECTIPDSNVYVVDVHDIMQRLDTAIGQTRKALSEVQSQLNKVNVDSVINEITKNLSSINIAVEKSNIEKLKLELEKSKELIKNTKIIVVTGQAGDKEAK